MYNHYNLNFQTSQNQIVDLARKIS